MEHITYIGEVVEKLAVTHEPHRSIQHIEPP